MYPGMGWDGAGEPRVSLTQLLTGVNALTATEGRLHPTPGVSPSLNAP